MSLYNPQVFPCVPHTALPFEELYKATLCNVALGKFYGRMFLLSRVAQLFDFLFSPSSLFQLKTKKQCAACALVRKNCDGKTCRRAGLYLKQQKDRASLVSHEAGIFAAPSS
jgi:hypothetical protein